MFKYKVVQQMRYNTQSIHSKIIVKPEPGLLGLHQSLYLWLKPNIFLGKINSKMAGMILFLTDLELGTLKH